MKYLLILCLLLTSCTKSNNWVRDCYFIVLEKGSHSYLKIKTLDKDGAFVSVIKCYNDRCYKSENLVHVSNKFLFYIESYKVDCRSIGLENE